MGNDNKKINFVEANVVNIYAKFQLHPPYGFWEEDFLIFFSKIYPFGCHGNQSKSVMLIKFIWLVEDYSRNISVQFCQNSCSNIEINAKFHFSHYKSMETLSCHHHMGNDNKKTQFM